MGKNKQNDSLEGIHNELINIRNSLKSLDGIASSVYSLSVEKSIKRLPPEDFQKKFKESKEEARRDEEIKVLKQQIKESCEQTKAMKIQMWCLIGALLLSLIGLIITLLK